MQNKVSKFNEKMNKLNVYARSLDIVSEVGELSKEVLKGTNYGKSDIVKSEDFEMELGDVMYSILSLANECKVDANACLDMVLEKYMKRLNKGAIGSEVENN